MRMTLLILILLPACLKAMPLPDLPVRPALFQSAIEDPPPPKHDFAHFALGSVFNPYPYYAVWDDRSANLVTEGSVPLPAWLEVRGAPLFSFERGVGVSADIRAAFLFAEIGFAYRQWQKGDDDSLAPSLMYGWTGPHIPLFAANVGVGVAFGQMTLPNRERPAGFMFSMHTVAYPVWPLSVAMDVTVGGMAGGVVDAGGALGVMVFRHLFVELGYRYMAAWHKQFSSQGLTLGVQFAWNWSNPRGKPFASPTRRNTW